MNAAPLVSIDRAKVMTYFLINLLVPVLLLFPSHEWIKDSYFTIFGGSYLLSLLFLQSARDKAAFLVSPAFLTVTYVCVSFALGGWAFKHGYVVLTRDIRDYIGWVNVRESAIFATICNLVVLLAYFFCERNSNVERRPDRLPSPNFYLVAYLLGLSTVFYFVRVDLAPLGGSGEISMLILTPAALALCVYGQLAFPRFRFLIYTAVIFVFSAISYEDKSNAIFFFFTIFLLEAVRAVRFRISPGRIAGFFVAVCFAMVLILAMSIKRGYGSFGNESFFGSFKFIGQYLGNDAFVSMFFNNIEVNYTFFHSNQAIEYAAEEPWNLSLGSTIIKTGFLPVPRTVFEKPQSMIHLYTVRRDATARKAGQSWPVNVYAEMFWNFRWFGLVPLLVVFLLFHKAYFFLIETVRKGAALSQMTLLYAFHTFLFYARGSGMDMYIMQVIFAAGLWGLFFVLPLKLFPGNPAGLSPPVRGKTNLPLFSDGIRSSRR